MSEWLIISITHHNTVWMYLVRVAKSAVLGFPRLTSPFLTGNPSTRVASPSGER